MAYTSAALVQAEFKSITFSATTAITSDDVTEFIAQEEALLDAKVSKKYSTPITAPAAALSVMKMIATLYVKARILDILAVKTGDQKTEQGVSGASLREKADKLVEGIVDGSIKLSTASLAEGTDGVQDYVSQNTNSDGSAIEPTFNREDDLW